MSATVHSNDAPRWSIKCSIFNSSSSNNNNIMEVNQSAAMPKATTFLVQTEPAARCCNSNNIPLTMKVDGWKF